MNSTKVLPDLTKPQIKGNFSIKYSIIYNTVTTLQRAMATENYLHNIYSDNMYLCLYLRGKS